MTPRDFALFLALALVLWFLYLATGDVFLAFFPMESNHG